MVVLDLTNNETLFGRLRYKISNFPDGQQSIEVSLVDPRDFYNMSHSVNEGVEIKCRMNSFKDVELIVLANQALKI